MTARSERFDRAIGMARSVSRAVAAGMAAVVIVAVITIGFGLARGYRPVIITTGSMTPTASTGSLVIAGPNDRVAPGDILVMRRDGRATVTHRIVEIEYNADGKPYAVTRGDANSEIDAAPYALGEEELT
ncbi:MAG: signal peptidase I, partial [Acidimicrobiia bacterium]|nr:signal peptidase I [Acidimicrobiia bacterium]